MSYTMTPVRSRTASWSRPGSAARVRSSNPAPAHPAASTKAMRLRRMGLSPPAEEQRAVVVPSHGVQVAAPRPEALNIARLPGDPESALRGPHGSEPPLAVAPQEESIAPVHPADLRFHTVEVAGEQQVEVAVPVEVGRKD